MEVLLTRDAAVKWTDGRWCNRTASFRDQWSWQGICSSHVSSEASCWLHSELWALGLLLATSSSKNSIVSSNSKPHLISPTCFLSLMFESWHCWWGGGRLWHCLCSLLWCTFLSTFAGFAVYQWDSLFMVFIYLTDSDLSSVAFPFSLFEE